MSTIDLPWTTESVIEACKAQLVCDGATVPVIAALVSNLQSPTQFALFVVLDEEKPAEPAQSGFLAKMKSMASNATSQAVKMQRQVTAGCNRLAATYNVKFVVPVASNVDLKFTAGSLLCSWAELPSGGGDPVRREFRLNNLTNKFANVFNASREISVGKMKTTFMPNSASNVFSWLWKYQPVIPLPVTELPASADRQADMGRVLCLSWNLAGLAPPEDNALNVVPSTFSKYKTQYVKFFRDHPSVDVVVLALQEASPLNAQTVLFKGSSTNYGEAWMDWFGDVLNTAIGRGSGEFVKTVGIVQVGLAVAMFVRNRFQGDEAVGVTLPMTSCVKTGTLGLTGNKGCVGLRSTLAFGGSLSFNVAVLNTHLASGEGKGDFRRGELTKVVNESSFGDDKSVHFLEADLAIVTGDLNSRCEAESDGMAISTDDELLTRMRDDGPGFIFSENEVRFPATYKLMPGEEGRLVFAMNRRPGWCDRVLFRSTAVGEGKSTKRFVCSQYDSLREIDMSDHTPVFAVFGMADCEASTVAKEDSEIQRAPAVADAQFRIGENDSDDDSDLFDK